MAQIAWSPQSLLDFEELCAARARTSETYAASFARKVMAVVESLRTSPLSGSEVDEYSDPAIRQRFCGKYRIIYRVVTGTVEILTIIHGARRLPKSPP